MVFKISTQQNIISYRYEIKRGRKSFYFESFIIIRARAYHFKKGQLISEEALLKAQEEFGEDAFTAGIGAEAVKRNFSKPRFEKRTKKLRDSIRLKLNLK